MFTTSNLHGLQRIVLHHAESILGRPRYNSVSVIAEYLLNHPCLLALSNEFIK